MVSYLSLQDLSNTNCADSYQGGWWYSHCQHVNINGKYTLGLTWYDSLENEWIALSKVEMKIRDKRIFNNNQAKPWAGLYLPIITQSPPIRALVFIKCTVFTT